MARLLVLGASGMMGHVLCKTAVALGHEVLGTAKDCTAARRALKALNIEIELKPLEATESGALSDLIRSAESDAVINCIGLIKQAASANDPISNISINALVPHLTARACTGVGTRFVHISTDCVFSGLKGRYVESDLPDATDMYGRSKALGEVSYGNAVTLRTSIVGWEIREGLGLLSWFARSRNVGVRGFGRALFSGLSTYALSRVILTVALERRDLTGLHHVSAAPISKLVLLERMRRALGWTDLEITADDSFVIDRSLESRGFWERLKIDPPSWEDMVRELAQEYGSYGKMRES